MKKMLFLLALLPTFLCGQVSEVGTGGVGKGKRIKPVNKQTEAKKKEAGKQDAKHTRLKIAPPEKDPELEKYYLSAQYSPHPAPAEAAKTSLPLVLKPNTRIAFIGNLQLDTERREGHLETLLHQHDPSLKPTVRNLAWPADEVNLMPRPENFASLDQHLHFLKSDLIIASFGYNESFAGKKGLPSFEKNLADLLNQLTKKAYNGKNAAQVILLSPLPNENTPQVKAADMNNENIALYTKAMQKIANQQHVAFIDLSQASSGSEQQLTFDGNARNSAGHALFAKATYRALFEKEAPSLNEDVRQLVVDKATQFAHRYRPLNSFYYTGSRNKTYGYLDFLPAMRNFDLMAANRDEAIHASAAGTLTKPDDSNLPKMEEVLLALGANEFLSPADELKAFNVDPRFEVNLFASEEDFPELACPISIRWDARGRLWVSTSTTYPHLYPGQKPADKILILEDVDQDGKADKCTTFADNLQIPLSFELDDQGGLYCSEEPHLLYLQDTDGDDKADKREIVYTGFGCEDSHHALHDFIWTPGGKLMFRESIFHHSQVETPYGPVRAKNSSWFLYNPKNRKLQAFGAYPNTNPWGVTYDKWGNHVASHPIFASTFHATNPPYPKQHPGAPAGIQAYSGVCGHAFVDHPIWPADLQGGFFKNRYKPTNNVEFHTWTEQVDHFKEDKIFDLIFSTNLSFIPVDMRFSSRGELFISDWYNPIKGHAQYSLRDPRRDRKAGRIWRVLPKGAQLGVAPQIEKQTISGLLDLLKSPQYITRYRAKRQLRARDHGEVKNALDSWIQKNKDPHDHLEALWVYQGIDSPNVDLLDELIHSENHLAASAAFSPLRFWGAEMPSDKISELLKFGATHPSQHVRREAVITASYLGSQEAYDAVLAVLEQPADVHLKYAIKTSFASAALQPFATAGSQAAMAQLNPASKKQKDTRSAKEIKFDQQKELQNLSISCIPERIQFTKTSLKAKAGKPVKLIFENPDATQHNFVLLKIGASIEAVGTAANEMAKSPDGLKKGYIPEDERILLHSTLLEPGKSETLRFIAPTKPGIYPYICTFPGHWTIMKGEFIVE